MLKHIGKHNDRKVVVLFHQIPDEPHMCLVTYSETLSRILHDTIMKAIESDVGQQAKDFADALFRTIMADGRNALEVLHKEGFMKKLQTSQVLMTPTLTSQIRLDELNKMLTEMATGAEAVKRMAEIDSRSGMQNKKKDNTKPREVGEPVAYMPPLQAGLNEALSDEVIAAQQIAQAKRMRAEATSMLSEATRLEAEAAALVPPVVEKAIVTENVKPVKAVKSKKVEKHGEAQS